MRKQKERTDQIKRVGRKMADGDLSKKARTEEALRQSEERYRTTMMSVGDGVIATDTEGQVELLNPVAESQTAGFQTAGRDLEGSETQKKLSLEKKDALPPRREVSRPSWYIPEFLTVR